MGRGERDTISSRQDDVTVGLLPVDHFKEVGEVFGENSEEVTVPRELNLCSRRPFSDEERQNSVRDPRSADSQARRVDPVEVVPNVVRVIVRWEEEGANILRPGVNFGLVEVLLGNEVDKDFLCIKR